jgi:hypothetical protein
MVLQCSFFFDVALNYSQDFRRQIMPVSGDAGNCKKTARSNAYIFYLIGNQNAHYFAYAAYKRPVFKLIRDGRALALKCGGRWGAAAT